MAELSDLVLEALEVFRARHDNLKSDDAERQVLISTYFKIVDVVYKDDVSKVLAYKKLWYSLKK